MSAKPKWHRSRRRAIIGGALIAGTAMCFLVVTPSAARSQADQSCRTNPRSSHCIEAEQRHLLERYGVPSIVERRDAGDQVRRVFFVDGAGSDLLLIEFIRARDSDPSVWVYFPRRGGEERIEPWRSAVPQAIWYDVLARPVFFDPRLAPLPADPKTAPICLDGGRYAVEATDPPSLGEAASLRQTVENGCDHGHAERYATEMARAALSLFPPCARLAPDQHPSSVLQLAACRFLHGDRVAAAEVLNRAEAFQAISNSGDTERLSHVLDERSVIDWNGERHTGRPDAASFWAAHAAPTVGVTNLIYRTVDGERADRVRLVGLLMRTVDTSRGRATGAETASVEQIWVGEGGSFRVASATVGPWEPFPQRR